MTIHQMKAIARQELANHGFIVVYCAKHGASWSDVGRCEQCIESKPLTCSEVVRPDFPTRENDQICGAENVTLCVQCHDAVCRKHSDSCYQCGQTLHEGCLDDHAKDTGHSIDIPKPMSTERGQQMLVALLDRETDRVLTFLEGRL